MRQIVLNLAPSSLPARSLSERNDSEVTAH
jgi:hypothetical protein